MQKLLQRSVQLSSIDNTSLFIWESSFRSASQLAIFLNHTWRASRLPLDLLIPVSKIAHDMLSLPRLDNTTTSLVVSSEFCRITSPRSAAELVRISALALLRIVVVTTSGDSLYFATHEDGVARKLLAQVGDDFWKGYEKIQLWVLVIQTLMETGSSRLWFLDQVTRVMSLVPLQSWDALMLSLHQVVWIKNIAMQEMTLLKSEIQGYLSASQVMSRSAPEMNHWIKASQ